MNKLSLFLLYVLLSSCGNNSISKNNVLDLLPEESELVKEKLDSILVEGVFKIIERGHHLQFPNIPLSKSFIDILFMINTVDSAIFLSDSIVRISYNIFRNYDNAQKYYKGIIDVNGYNVAIFDLGNTDNYFKSDSINLNDSYFGYKYYNVDSLKLIPLEKFKPYPMEYIIEITYFVRDGKLHCWQCE